MIDAVLRWSLANRLWVVGAALWVASCGARSLFDTPVDAIPDLGENQVIVTADWPGRGPREVEDQITAPLSSRLQGVSDVKAVRAGSMFGFSLVTVVFEDRVGRDLARQHVSERLNALGDKLPAGVVPTLGPDASGLGWIFEYTLSVDPSKTRAGGGCDLGELRSIQDWTVRPALAAVPGVAEVAGVGGFVRQFQIEADSRKLRAAGVSLNALMEAVGESNQNVGGKTIEENGMEFIVRGVGLLHGVADLESIVVASKDGRAIRVRDLARVEVGGDYRRGALDVDGNEAVGGIVVMRSGANARDVITRVKEALSKLEPALPPGVVIRPVYDRSELIGRTLGTLRRALIEEILLVTAAHIVFLAHFRSILIVTLPLPVSVLVSFLLMNLFGVTSNIMSLSGIAIAIGVLVDGAIVLTENALRRCEEAERRKGAPLSSAERRAAVLEASLQVGRPIFFAMAVILFAFAPVFALTGQEGKLFQPLAFAKSFAMAGAAVLAVTLAPVLCTFLIRGRLKPEDGHFVMRALLRLYEPALDFALARPLWVVAPAALLLAGALALAPRLGTEFMPPLDEGGLLYMPTFAPGVSLSEVRRVMAWQDRVLKGFPEVLCAAGKLGRADTATDPAPAQMVETVITLKPRAEWRPGMTKDRLIAEMTEALRLVPGSIPGFLQPVEGRLLMLSTGIRSRLGIKIFGDDIDRLQSAAEAVQKVVEAVPGAAGAAASRTQGAPAFEVRVDREALARYGMREKEVLDVVEAGLGGRTVSTIVDGRRRAGVQVRLQRSEREDLTRLRDVIVTGASGTSAPLGQLAELVRTEGPDEIDTENGRLRAFVQADVRGRTLSDFVGEVKGRLDQDLAPRLAAAGLTLEYGGEYENERRAARTLWLITPAAVLIIFLILKSLYGCAREAAHVLLAAPFALSGGVFLQAVLGLHFSVAVAVGYIALFGTAIQTAVVMVAYLDEAVRRRRAELGAAFGRDDLVAAVKEGARRRLRPKVMTVATIVASLLPIFWSRGAGADVMRPIAAPILGGMATSFLHILLVTPVLFAWLRARDLAPAAATVRPPRPATAASTRPSPFGGGIPNPNAPVPG